MTRCLNSVLGLFFVSALAAACAGTENASDAGPGDAEGAAGTAGEAGGGGTGGGSNGPEGGSAGSESGGAGGAVAGAAGDAGGGGGTTSDSGNGGGGGGDDPDGGSGSEGEPPAAAEVVKSGKSRLLAPEVSDSEREALREGNTQFALDLYGVLTDEAEDDENLFFSPHSISVALAMTYAGARNNTEAEMAETLHFTLEQDRLHAAFNQLDLELTSRAEQGHSGQKGFRLRIANAIWPRKGVAFAPDYLDILAEHYGAGLYALDFGGDPEGSRLIINDWVAEQTEDRIQNLLAPGTIDGLTFLVLTNAIYFHAAWREAFQVAATEPGDFTRRDGSQVNVPMMNQTTSMSYAQGTGWKAVELPYERPEIGMVVILPDDFGSFEADWSTSSLADILAELKPAQVRIAMPKFRFTAERELTKALKALGMTDAFSGGGGSDFTGMTVSSESLFGIGAVVHKAFIDVNEEGTEAAAATAVVMDGGMAGDGGVVEEMLVDRPFVFLIWDRPTGAILFLGRVVDPS